MANANAGNVFFQLGPMQRSTAGQSLGQGLSSFGAGVGAAIQGHRRKQEKKQQEEAMTEFLMGRGYAKDEQEAKAVVKAFGGPREAFGAFMMEQQRNMEHARLRAAETQAEAAMVGAEASRTRAETDRAEFEFARDMTPEKMAQAEQEIQIRMLNAQNAAELNQLKTEQFMLEKTKLQMAGDIMDLGGGARAFHDGNSWKVLPGTKSRTAADAAIELNKILDEDSPLGIYYNRTRNEKGEIKKKFYGMGGEETTNPAFEKTIQSLGLPAFGVDNNAQPVNQGVPTPKTQEEFDALPKGSLYIDPQDGKTYRK